MSNLLRIALAAARLAAQRGAEGALRRLGLVMLAGTVALAGFVGGLFWLAAALWFYLLPMLGAPIAAVVVGAALVMIALAILLWIGQSAPRQPAAAIGAGAATPDVAQLAHQLNGFARRNAPALLVIAALAGLMSGASPPRR